MLFNSHQNPFKDFTAKTHRSGTKSVKQALKIVKCRPLSNQSTSFFMRTEERAQPYSKWYLLDFWEEQHSYHSALVAIRLGFKNVAPYWTSFTKTLVVTYKIIHILYFPLAPALEIYVAHSLSSKESSVVTKFLLTFIHFV